MDVVSIFHFTRLQALITLSAIAFLISISGLSTAAGFNSSSLLSRSISNQVKKSLFPKLFVNKGTSQSVVGVDVSHTIKKMVLWTPNEISLWDLYYGKEIRRIPFDGEIQKIEIDDSHSVALVLEKSGSIYLLDFFSDKTPISKINIPSKAVDIDYEGQWVIKSASYTTQFAKYSDGGFELSNTPFMTERLASEDVSFTQAYVFDLEGEFDLSIKNGRDGSRLLFYILDDGWLVLDDYGRYDSSFYKPDRVEWVADKYKFKLRQFSDTYYEPGLLAKFLESQPTNTKVSAISEGVKVPPTLAIRSERVGENAVSVTIESSSDEYLIDLYQNGKIISTHGDGFEFNQKVNLVSGTNELLAVGRRDGQPNVESESLSIKGIKVKNKTTLYVSSVGIDNFESEELQLNYAVKDASVAGDKLNSVISTQYDDSISEYIYDSKATRHKLSEELERLSKSHKEDFVIVYMSGHGVVFDGEWYFLSSENESLKNERKIKAHSISSNDLVNFISSTPAQKVLLIIDACQSGSVLDRFDTFRQQKLLSKISDRTGIHVLTATRADQLAPEFESLGHGLFTYTLLNGLEVNDGRFNADRYPQDNELKIEELKRYVAEYVPVLAGHLTDEATLKGDKGPYVWQPMSSGLGSNFTLHSKR